MIGFACATCAACLETLLGRKHGVLSVVATCPKGLAQVTLIFEALTLANRLNIR